MAQAQKATRVAPIAPGRATTPAPSLPLMSASKSVAGDQDQDVKEAQPGMSDTELTGIPP